MGKGAIHYTGSNFPRVARLDVVQRMRLLVQQDVVRRPLWLQAAERAPPLELLNIKLLDRRVPNKYMKLTQEVLRKYPNMRFMDCFVDGNDWSKGNDVYRADHPVMQFVALQLRLMNFGVNEKAAFQQAEKAFFARRIALEKQQKLSMAAAVAAAVARDPAAAAAAATAATAAAVPSSSQARVTAMGLGEVQPLFTTGQAYWQFRIAQSQANHLLRIRHVLRRMRWRAEAAAAKEGALSAQEEEAGDSRSSRRSPETTAVQRNVFPSLRQRTFSASGRRMRAALLQQQQQPQQQQQQQQQEQEQQSPSESYAPHPQRAAATAALPGYASAEALSAAAEEELWEAEQEDIDPTQWLDEMQTADINDISSDD